MKRVLITLLAIFMVLCFMPIVSMAADGPVVTVGNVSGKAGDTVEVPVTLSGNTGYSSLAIEVGFDSNVVELVSVAVPDGVYLGLFEQSPAGSNPYALMYVNFTNVTYNGLIATVTFKISSTVELGAYDITVDCYEGPNGDYIDGYDCNYDENYDDIKLSYINGKVTVQSAVKPEISVDKSYTLATTQTINGVETPVIYIYGLFNDFNVTSDEEFGFKLWNTKNEDAKISLPSLVSVDPVVADTPASGKAFVIKAYGKAITKGNSYGYASYIGEYVSDTANTVAVN